MKTLKDKTRRVIRLTLIKKNEKKDKISNMEPEHVKQYSALIAKAKPDFIHVKGFKALGFSRKRFENSYNKQPFHEEIKEFAKKLEEELKINGYKILDEEKRSCIVLLGKDKRKMKIKKNQI